ncbi:efflux RND transporter periplasmic adaptor subunit [Ideonella livida]|uniref:HlyD family efflux transporter periplasmic adaptor subunit n=1 Tax=Ideonella livida TaxID=2707176 RepID=A0A7C9TN12_9BURK|nr:HlyD family efflux transporter periplasmic adaptor subunit [Ideonella livida]NDY93403.1 HlyD family efflux transporter periplasmic adaptor subunit [Ideonella livida]
MSTPDLAALALLVGAQEAPSAQERRFLLLNRCRDLWPVQIAVLWENGRVSGHSGGATLDPLGPYAQWLQRLHPHLATLAAGLVDWHQLPPELADEAAEWWPTQVLWCPLPDTPPARAAGDPADGVALVRDVPWSPQEAQQAQHWVRLWHSLDRQARDPRDRHARRWRQHLPRPAALLLLAALAGAGTLPVPLTVRAPAELVPREPMVVRAASEGTVRRLRVEPNQPVRAGEVLVEMDDAGWAARADVARQALATAETEWRQISQQALFDPKAKAQLAAAQGKVRERQAELALAQEQSLRTSLRAPQDGVALVQDPGSWPGRTVAAGEAILRVANPRDQEVEAWLAAGDAVDLREGAAMRLHLEAQPGEPVNARLRLFAYEAETRPDLGLGYRLRGTLQDGHALRLGARGTVHVDGPEVPLAYWVLRRPLAALRESTGW